MKTTMRLAIAVTVILWMSMAARADTSNYTINADLTVTGNATFQLPVSASSDFTVLGNACFGNYIAARGFGYQASVSATNCAYAFAGGDWAQYYADNCHDSVAVGAGAQFGARDSYYAFVGGPDAQAWAYRCMRSVAIGSEAQLQAANCYYTVAVGYLAQQNATNSYNAVALGMCAQRGQYNSPGAVAIGISAQGYSAGGTNSVYIGAYAGADTVAAPYCAGFGPYTTVQPNSQYRYAYGVAVTNNVADFSHVFGHLGMNYCAISKDEARFNVPITTTNAPGDISMGSYTNSP
jgi:hypothetical protein